MSCHYGPLTEELDDTKGVIRIRKSKKDRQHNSQKKKDKKDKQRSTKHTHKIKDRATRMENGRYCNYDKLNIFVLLCDTDIS
jgi:hypothetical protein